MAEKKLSFDIPHKSKIYIAVGVIVVLLLILGGILPAGKKLMDLDASIVAKKRDFEEQKAFAPIFKSLKADSEKKEMLLPMPPKAKLSQARIDTIPSTFRTAAKMSGMRLVSATPLLNAINGNSQSIPVDVILRGRVIDFRRFLIQLGGIPYIQQVEEITIQDKAETREFKIKVWAALG